MSTQQNTRPVVISGLGISCPLGRTMDEFNRNLLAGKSAIEEVRIFDTEALTCRVAVTFGPETRYQVPETLRKVADKASLSAYEAYREALQDAGADLTSLDPKRIAVVVGSSHAGIESTETVFLKTSGLREGSLDPREVFSILTSSVGNIIGSSLGAQGPRLTVSSACASSNTALGIASDLVSTGQADFVLVLGTDSVSLAIMAGFNALRALSPGLTAPFSEPAGLNLGEGAAAAVVEPWEAVEKRGRKPWATILGYGLSSDAYHITAPDVTGDGARRAMVEALRDAGVAPGEIDYVSAHGTGTDANDKAESKATRAVFGENTPVSSPKSYLGHTLGASGLMEAVVTLLYARAGKLPPTQNFKGVREGCEDLNYVPNQPQDLANDLFCCNNFGFGGNNSSLILSAGSRRLPVRSRKSREVVIVGSGAVTVHGSETEAFDRASSSARSPEYTLPGQKVPPFKFSQKELLHFARSAPMIKYGLKAASNTLNGHLNRFTQNTRYGLLGGMLNGSSSSISKYFESVFVDGPGLASAQHFPMTTVNATAGQVAIAFGITGYTSTFCGSLGAFYYGRELVRWGRQDGVLVVASDDLHETALKIYDQIGLRAPWTEGAAALALESEEQAEKQGAEILGRIAGLAVGQSPVLFGASKNGTVLAGLITAALEDAGVSAASISTVVTTGCGVNRMEENNRKALEKVFGSRSLEIHSALDVAGYAPAATPMMNIHLALSLLKTSDPLLVLETDISGNLMALILKK